MNGPRYKVNGEWKILEKKYLEQVIAKADLVEEGVRKFGHLTTDEVEYLGPAASNFGKKAPSKRTLTCKNN